MYILSNVLEHINERVPFKYKIKPKFFIIRVPAFDRDWRIPLKKELGVEWKLDNTHYIEYTKETLLNELLRSNIDIIDYKVTGVKFADWESKKLNLFFFLLWRILQQWSKEGILDRELALYKKLEKHNISTSIISFGDKTEEEILIKHPYIKVLYNKYNLHPRLYSYLIPLLFFEVLKKADLIKTNQFYGVHLAKNSIFFQKS